MALDASQTAVLEIIIRAQNQAAAALQQASSQVGGLRLSLAATGAAALMAGETITRGLEAALGAVVGPGMQFQQTMSGVQAVSDATGVQMQKLGALALQLGKDTVFSANDAGSAIEELSKGGIGIQDILSGAARATVNLAAAGGVDLPQAATIAANAMNTFALSGTQMAHVSDMIAGAANASSLEVGDFAYSLQYAGSFARTVGLSFDDLAVAIAEMGRSGITGSAAGTGLADFLARLQPRAGQALKTMEQLGLVTKQGGNAFFDAAGHIKSLADVQQILQHATAGLTDQQRAHDIQLIFGMQGQTAANVLLREGAAGYDAMAAAMGKVTAQGVAGQRMNNLAGDVEQFRGSVDTLEISLEKTSDSTLRRLMQAMTGAVNGALEWVGANQALLQSIVPVAGALAGVAAAALTVGGAAALVLAALNPVTVAMAAVGAGAVALGAAWATNWGGIRDTLSGAWSAMQPAIEAIRYSVGAIVTDFQTMPLGDALTASWGIVQATLGRAVGWMESTALPAIKGKAGEWASALGSWAGTVWDTTLHPALDGLGTQMVGWITGLARTIEQNTNAWADALTNWIDPAAKGVPGQMNTWTDALTAWMNSDGAQAMSRLGDALARLFVTAFEDALKQGVQASLNWATGQAGSFIPFMPRLSGPGLDLLPQAGNIAGTLPGLGLLPGLFGALQGGQTQAAAPAQTPPPPVTVSVPPSAGGVQERDMLALVQSATRAALAHADALQGTMQATIASSVAGVFAHPALSGASTVALERGNQSALADTRVAFVLSDMQRAIQRLHEGAGPAFVPPGLAATFGETAAQAAAGSGAGTGTGSGTGSGTSSALGLGGGGGGPTINISVSVGAGAVSVTSGAGGTAQERDYGRKVGEAIADALATFARAERMVSTPPRPAVGGARG